MIPIDTELKRYVQARPEYREPLNFLQGLLDFQASLVEKIEPRLCLEPATAQQRWRAGQCLLENESLSIQPSLLRETLADLQSILPPLESMQLALNGLLNSEQLAHCKLRIGRFELRIFDSNIENPKPVLSKVEISNIQNLEAFIQQIAQVTASEPDTVAFLLQTVLSPFVKKQVMPYQDLIEGVAWRRGMCPMCGSEPWLARLSYDNGQRILACSLCDTEWPFDRLRCPFCQGNGQPRLRHFTVDGDEAHRVDCCDQCRRYLKTIDERVLGHPAYLPAEDVITAHLDALAREQAYR